MRTLFYITFILTVFNSCKKEDSNHQVMYKVTVIGGSPTYAVKYSSSDNSTATAGPITGSGWSSSTIERKPNTTVFLTLEGGSGGSYKMYIYVDGHISAEERMDDPYGPKTIEAVIPD
ncbi:MAG: hypothetical protein K0S44_3172 [Bacteroidetes bacterium]|jgi:hypothetical protein|nr:hypothetical protein [Bacteroidota bacterium]